MLNSCSKDEVSPAVYRGHYLSFGKEYELYDEGSPKATEGGCFCCYKVFDAEAHKIELYLYDMRKNYAPVETFDIRGVAIYHEQNGLKITSMSDIDILHGINWDSPNPNAVPDFSSLEYAELGEGETFHHSFGWFNIQHVKNIGEPQKIVVTIPENNTGQIRGFNLCAGIDDGYPIDGMIQIYQLPKEDSLADDSRFPMQIRYKGKVYSSMAEIDENGEYHYDDFEFEKMMCYLDNTPGIDAVVKDNLIVDYYDADDPVYLNILNGVDRPIDQTLSLTPVSTPLSKTRADGFELFTQGSIGYYAAFSDGEFKGEYLTFTPKNMHNSHNLRDLKLIGMNDKLSSVAVYYGGDLQNVCAVLTVWENGNYNFDDNNIPRKKHRVSFIATYYNRKISRNSLKNVKLINASGSWNDRISALSFHFAYLDTPLMDY
ncbi:MAG: hypothetical protein K2H86_00905 [Muribaculaceae bacterium]|nr:hypothetical protein [Muribaculaceae bacterium]